MHTFFIVIACLIAIGVVKHAHADESSVMVWSDLRGVDEQCAHSARTTGGVITDSQGSSPMFEVGCANTFIQAGTGDSHHVSVGALLSLPPFTPGHLWATVGREKTDGEIGLRLAGGWGFDYPINDYLLLTGSLGVVHHHSIKTTSPLVGLGITTVF